MYNLILSICIPSFNRFEVLKKNVESILKSKCENFEVVIVDNCSDSDIVKYFSDISDDRLQIYKRKNPLDGRENISTCFDYCKGEYSLLCLDKDWINGEQIADFIEALSINNIYGGYCKQNKIDKNNYFRIERKNPVLKFGYLGRHPSGMFYKTETIKNVIKNMQCELKMNAFGPDFLAAECAAVGSMMYYEYPIVFLEKAEEASKTKSYAYKNEKDIYFYPVNRFEQFMKYYKHSNGICIDNRTKDKLFARMYKTTLLNCTFGFKAIMSNKMICDHYYISSRVVDDKEILQCKRDFKKSVLKNKEFKKSLKKLSIVIYFDLYFYIRFWVEKVKGWYSGR